MPKEKNGILWHGAARQSSFSQLYVTESLAIFCCESYWLVSCDYRKDWAESFRQGARERVLHRLRHGGRMWNRWAVRGLPKELAAAKDALPEELREKIICAAALREL